MGREAVEGGPIYAELTMSPFMRDIIGLLPGAVAGHNWRGCEE
jgi:hypothetical protein